MIFSSSIPLLANFMIMVIVFNSRVILVHCVNVPPFLYPFFSLGISTLFLVAGYHKWSFSERSWASVLYGGLSFNPSHFLTLNSFRNCTHWYKTQAPASKRIKIVYSKPHTSGHGPRTIWVISNDIFCYRCDYKLIVI